MDANAIQVIVRVRPWHPVKELPFISQHVNEPVFLGDGNYASSSRTPTSTGALREVVETIDDRALDFDRPDPSAAVKRGQPGTKRYRNRRVFTMETGQETVFERTAKPLIPGVLEGFNATVFAYGATGCGKTHTISGNPEDVGIIVRTMRHLFELIEESKNEYDTVIEVTFVEIYNEMIRDLLVEENPNGGLKLLENEKNRVSVDKVTRHRPASAEEVMGLVAIGNGRRTTSYTHSNSESSRSHAILQINVSRSSHRNEVDFEDVAVRQNVTSATLSIIDLAGSERAAATKNIGARMKEGANINKSLLALSSCIKALCERPVRGRTVHVPYRDSKLTRMLKFSLGGNCRTAMIVCVSPSSRDIEDTHNTLMWADRAKSVSTKITQNTEGVSVRVQQYLNKIAEQELKVADLNEEIKKLRSAGSVDAENSATLAKKERMREQANQVLDETHAEIQSYLFIITEGAEKRALWDASELTISALEKHARDIASNPGARTPAGVKRETEHIDLLVKRETAKFRDNVKVHHSVHREMGKCKTIDVAIRNRTEKSYEGLLTEWELGKVKNGLDLERALLDKEVAAARERGYRQANREQAINVAGLSALVASLSLLMTAKADEWARSHRDEDATFLQSLVDRCDGEHVLMLNRSRNAQSALPPVVSFKDVPAMDLSMIPPTPPTNRSFSHAPIPPSPFFLRPGSMSDFAVVPPPALFSPLRPGFPGMDGSVLPLRSPALDRLKGKRAVPARRVFGSSPRRARPPLSAISGAMKGKKSALVNTSLPRQLGVKAKSAAFKSDLSLVEERTLSDTPGYSSSGGTPGDVNDTSEETVDDSELEDADEAADVVVELPHQIRASMSLPSRRISTLGDPVRRPALSSVFAQSAAGAANGPAAQASGSSTMQNDWRAARARNNLSQQSMSINDFGLNSISEVGDTSSMATMTKGGSMGPPARVVKPAPLGELHQLPAASSSGSGSGSGSSGLAIAASTSRLTKATASSAARSSNADSSMLLPIPGLSASIRRRESSIGPAASMRSHKASGPYAQPRPSIASVKPGDLSKLGGPSRRISVMPGNASMSLNAPSEQHHSAIAPIRATAPSQPTLSSRASMSQLQQPSTGLTSRMSMSNLRGVPVPVSATGRGAWK